MDMEIVAASPEHQAEGFTAAIRLGDAFFEKILELLKSDQKEDKKRLQSEIKTITELARNNKLSINDEEGEDEVILEIKGKQRIFFADFSGIKDALVTIFLGSLS